MHHREHITVTNVARTIVAAGIVAAGIVTTALTMPATAAAAAEADIVVTARMAADAEPVGPGDGVDVAVELENRGATSQRVRLDEIVTGVVDDARIALVSTSSSVDVTVVRVGRDRLGLSGRLAAGAAVTLTYRAILDDPAAGGDGMLSRSIVAADEDAPECPGTATPAAVEGLGVCTVLLSSVVSTTEAMPSDTLLSSSVAAIEGTTGVSAPIGPVLAAPGSFPTLALAVAVIGPGLVVVLGIVIARRGRGPVIARRGRGPVRRPRHSTAARGVLVAPGSPLRPAPSGRSPRPVRVTVTPGPAPIPTPTPISGYSTRRERRLAESRAAVPVA
ncbi:hypothetical protein ELQ92_12355 [Labedella populi]|uniref:DUF7927 domain-containing protein n=1 Tax=Labedella populi TaxID=2498850 RepID=A0A3S4AZL7_9MICO|nr:hypothetical protein [Labedella populi]RWZ59613.1 hypothetical protein ELQ92_12355 [Labedella populi]